MKCVVCGSSKAIEMRTHSDEVVGVACRGECAGLMWEAFFLGRHGTATERAEVAWRWRRLRAELDERLFSEPCPKTPGELACDRWVSQFDPWVVSELS